MKKIRKKLLLYYIYIILIIYCRYLNDFKLKNTKKIVHDDNIDNNPYNISKEYKEVNENNELKKTDFKKSGSRKIKKRSNHFSFWDAVCYSRFIMNI